MTRSWAKSAVVLVLLLAAGAAGWADVVAAQAWQVSPGGPAAAPAGRTTAGLDSGAGTAAATSASAAEAAIGSPGSCSAAAAMIEGAAEQRPDSSRLGQINWLLLGSAGVDFPGCMAAAASAGVVPPPAWPADATELGQTSDARGAAEQVTELPPAPSSFALVLSALASFGAYQGVRSLKRVHLGTGLSHLPDWYHADAVQVGHVTPIQIEFDLSALPACVFDAPAAERPLSPAAFERSRLDVGVFRVILAIPTRAPRSPPAC